MAQSHNRPWPIARITKPGKVDPGETGISFVDVLFALVVAEGFEPLRDWDHLPNAGRWHLGVAVVLTLTSWIGYHTSKNRPRYEIRFFNWPFVQFLLDVAMVTVYWIAITTHEKARLDASARPEASLVLVAFVLYSAWDLVGWRIKASGQYSDAQPSPGDWWRRGVTFAATAAALVLYLIATAAEHGAWWDGWVKRIDAGLLCLFLIYRIAKELVTPVRPEDSVRDVSLADLAAQLDTIQRHLEADGRAAP